MRRKLRIEALSVESFEVTPAVAERRGTVRGNESGPATGAVECYSLKESCGGTCIVNDTCDGFSCNGTCHPTTCTTTDP
jgi:hypothetical protein